MPANYSTMLDQSLGMYSGILGGYATALSQQQAAQQGVMAGYNQLQNQVLGGLAGQGQTRSADIAAQYTQRAGQAMQGLISRGLGNSTIQASVGRGLAFDETRAQNALTEDIARMNAEYQSRLGLASLGYQAQAAQQNSALLSQQLGYQSGWQSNLLGASLQGLGREEAYRNQLLNRMNSGGIGPSGGYGGGGGGRTYGYTADKTHMAGGYYPGWTPGGAGYLNFGGSPSPNSSWGPGSDAGVFSGGGFVEGPGYLMGAVAGAGGFDPGFSGGFAADDWDESFWYGGD